MFKWLIRLLVKPIVTPIKEGIKLCTKLVNMLDILARNIKGLPLEDVFKVEILKNIQTTITSVYAVRDVLVHILDYIGEDVPSTDSDVPIEEVIKSIKDYLK